MTPDVLRSLVLATRFLGVTEIAVMQHTNCALADQTDDDVRTRLGAEGTDGRGRRGSSWPCPIPTAPCGPTWPCCGSVRSCPTGYAVEGWRYDVATGRIRRVVPS